MWNKKSTTVPPAGASIKPYTDNWRLLKRTTNTTIYAIERRIVALVPNEGAVGHLEAALVNIDFLNTYFREHGPGMAITYVDGLVSQDAASRRAYRERIDRSVVLGGAMVAGSLLGRAIAAFFLKMMVADAPFRLFGSANDALTWARNILREYDNTSDASEAPAGGALPLVDL